MTNCFIRLGRILFLCCLLLGVGKAVRAQDSTTKPKELEHIVIKAKDRPVEARGDTISYKISFYHAKPNADLGELMNKMPGMETDADGMVTAMGRAVERVLVNGKKFFAGDPTFAIKMLPPDIILRVEVYDDKSDEAKATGIDDGVRIHTLNIITKIDVRQGDVGKVSLGAGNEGLYNTDGSLTHFDKDRNISVRAAANNTTATPGGTTRLWNDAVNFTDSYKNNTHVNLSYSQDHSVMTSATSSFTQNLVPGDSSFFVQSSQQGNNTGGSQRFNGNFETNIDSSDHVIFTGALGWRQHSSSSASVAATTKGVTLPVTNSANQSSDQGNNDDGNFSMVFSHQFHKKGRGISLSVNGTHNTTVDNGTNDYVNQYYMTAGDSVASARQTFHAPGKNTSTGETLSYTEPISEKSVLQLSYNYSVNLAQTARYTYQLDTLTDLKVPDSLLTNTFSNSYHSQRWTLNYSYIQKQHYRVTAGLGLQQADNRSVNNYKGQVLTQSYWNIDPQAGLTYTFKDGGNLDIQYNGRPVQPSLEQLQPLIDNSDPLHVHIGNPHLRESFSHHINLRYINFNQRHMSPIYVNMGVDFAENTIVQKTVTNLSTGADTTTLVNLNGNYNFHISSGYNLNLKKLKSSVNLWTNLSDAHTEGFINNSLNGTSTYDGTISLRFSTNLARYLDANLTFAPDYHIARYSAEPTSNNHYLQMGVNSEVTGYTDGGWLLSSSVHLTSYSGRSAGYNTTIAVWNASIAHLFFPKKRGELRFTVYDLLNQNRSVERVETPTSIQDTQSKLLARYAMLSFIYNLRSFGNGH